MKLIKSKVSRIVVFHKLFAFPKNHLHKIYCPCKVDLWLTIGLKPRLNTSEACHRLAPSEGQKEFVRRLKAVQKRKGGKVNWHGVTVEKF